LELSLQIQFLSFTTIHSEWSDSRERQMLRASRGSLFSTLAPTLWLVMILVLVHKINGWSCRIWISSLHIDTNMWWFYDPLIKGNQKLLSLYTMHLRIYDGIFEGWLSNSSYFCATETTLSRNCKKNGMKDMSVGWLPIMN
jgi:glycosyltransferase involved in cell wall biosynthesis